jgi:hypothetical protein
LAEYDVAAPDANPSYHLAARRQRGRSDRARRPIRLLRQQDGADDRRDQRREDHREPESEARRGSRGRGWGRHSFIMSRAVRGFQQPAQVQGKTLNGSVSAFVHEALGH